VLSFSFNTSTHSKLQNLYRIEFTTLSSFELIRDGFISTQFFLVYFSFIFRFCCTCLRPALAIFDRYRF